MSTHALIQDGKVVNVIVVDDAADFELPDGATLAEYSGAWGQGWAWDGAKAVDPNPPVQKTGGSSVIAD